MRADFLRITTSYNSQWAFPEKNVTPLLRISMEISRGVEKKSFEFQGGNQKLRKKHVFPGESMQKK